MAPLPPPMPMPSPPAARRSRAGLLVALALLVVVALGAGAFLLVGGRDERAPDEALAAAQAAADDATSFRFVFSAEDTYGFGDPADAGSTTTDRYNGEGEWSGERWHVLSHDGYSDSETIFGDDASYDRSVDTGGDLDGEQWARWEMPGMSREETLQTMSDLRDEVSGDEESDDDFADSFAVDTAAGLYLGGVESAAGVGGDASSFLASPSGFLSTIKDMAEPVVVDEQSDVLTLGATLHAADDFVEAYGSPLPDGKIEMDVDADDVPTALRLDVKLNDASMHVAIELSDWNQPVDIAIPSDDEIDESPWIDEDEVRAAAGEVALYAPTEVPGSWEISLLEKSDPDFVFDLEADESLADCTIVDIDWDDSSDLSEDAGYAYLYQFSTECAMKSDSTPFEPDGPGGLPSRDDDYNGYIQVQIGDTVIAVDTSLEDAELDAFLASLQPADVESLIDQAKSAAAGYGS